MNTYLKSFKSRFLPKTIFGRSLAIIVVPVLLTQFIVGYIFFDRPWDNLVDKIIYSLTNEISSISRHIENASPDVRAKVAENAKADFNIEVVFNKYDDINLYKNVPLGMAWQRVEGKFYSTIPTKISSKFNIRTIPETNKIEVNIKYKDGDIVTYRFSHKRVMSPTSYIFFLWLIGVSVLLGAISITFMRNQLKPIRRLSVAAERFGKGQDTVNFKVEGATEVRQAGQAFVEMRERIKRQIEQRTAMLAGVSHDLKTPLTRMKLQLAMMKNDPEVEFLKQDVEEMEVMLEGYLNFARGEGDEGTEYIDLKQVIERIISKVERSGHEVNFKTSSKEVIMSLRPIAIERAISNIIGNACKYAENAWISLERNDTAVEITVEDNGTGIPEAQRNDVFKPFFRLEKSRNKKTGGVGLGLSIAQDIVHAHGGEIYLSESSHGGLKVLISLPH